MTDSVYYLYNVAHIVKWPNINVYRLRMNKWYWSMILLYAYCSFSAVIGQIMVTWPPYKSDIGVQYHFPTLWLRAFRFMCSILNFNYWKGSQQKWIETRNSEEFGLLVKSWLGKELVKHIFKLNE